MRSDSPPHRIIAVLLVVASTLEGASMDLLRTARRITQRITFALFGVFWRRMVARGGTDKSGYAKELWI